MRSTNIFKLLVLLIFVLSYGTGKAHDIPISEIQLVPDDSQIHLELRLNLFELTFVSEIDENKNRNIEKEEFKENREAIKQKILQALKLKLGRNVVEAESAALRLDESHHVIFRAHYPMDGPAQSLVLVSELQSVTDQSHVTLVKFGSSADKQLAKLDHRLNSATFSLPLSQSTDDGSVGYNSVGGLLLLLAFSIILVGGIIWINYSKREANLN